MNTKFAYTKEVAQATSSIFDKLNSQYSEAYWKSMAPYIYKINRLKKEKNAIILAHNYQTPDIFYGVADIVGDSLKLAQEAAKTDAEIIIQCGVHFMAETSKILSPEKRVFIPDFDAGCSLAESINANDVKKLKEKYPNTPVVTYVNTSADVKAETDICCTSSNAVNIVKKLAEQGHKQVLLIPDEYLALNVAKECPEIKVITWERGHCEVHERFTPEDIKNIRKRNEDVVILAHPECPPEVVDECDFSGSTSQMQQYVEEKRPKKAALITECSMSDNIAAANPDLNLVTPCQLCPHMKKITLPKILKSLQEETGEVFVDKQIAIKAKKSVDAMLEMSK